MSEEKKSCPTCGKGESGFHLLPQTPVQLGNAALLFFMIVVFMFWISPPRWLGAFAQPHQGDVTQTSSFSRPSK